VAVGVGVAFGAVAYGTYVSGIACVAGINCCPGCGAFPGLEDREVKNGYCVCAGEEAPGPAGPEAPGGLLLPWQSGAGGWGENTDGASGPGGHWGGSAGTNDSACTAELVSYDQSTCSQLCDDPKQQESNDDDAPETWDSCAVRIAGDRAGDLLWCISTSEAVKQ
jgi:hypothetical protein